MSIGLIKLDLYSFPFSCSPIIFYTLLLLDQSRNACSLTLNARPVRIRGKSALIIICLAVGSEQLSAAATSFVLRNFKSLFINSLPFSKTIPKKFCIFPLLCLYYTAFNSKSQISLEILNKILPDISGEK